MNSCIDGIKQKGYSARLCDLGDTHDYSDKNGIMHCGVCGEPIEYIAPKMGRVPVPCKCHKDYIAAQKEQMRRSALDRRVAELRFKGLIDPFYRDNTFERDDVRNPKASEKCRKYVDKFAEMSENNIGMIMTDVTGTGKSFLASCIVNALIAKGVAARMSTLSELIHEVGDLTLGMERIEDIKSYDLLVIDDLGAERDTEYSNEQAFNVINARYLSKRPTIVTTNLTLDNLKHPATQSKGRIYGRILEMCGYTLELQSGDKRLDMAREKYKVGCGILE